MALTSNPPNWLVKVSLIVAFAMASAWASYITTQALEVRSVDSKVKQQEVSNKADHELINYKLDLILKLYGVEPAQEAKRK